MTTAAAHERVLPFSEDAMVRRVHREGVLLLGGGRALLMQIAHPAVAAGVARHSSYRKERFGRLLRTLRVMLAIVFADERQVAQAAGSVNALHARVKGPGYDALDPRLLTWVLATLIDTSLQVHGLLLRPLLPAEKQAYYEDMARIGGLLGIPRGYLPASFRDFEAYTRTTCDSLAVSAEGRAIAAELLQAPLWLQPAMLPLRQLTAGLLPPALREQYGLAWGPRRQLAFAVAAAASRRVLPLLPQRLRATPWFLMPGAWLDTEEREADADAASALGRV